MLLRRHAPASPERAVQEVARLHTTPNNSTVDAERALNALLKDEATTSTRLLTAAYAKTPATRSTNAA
jgi:hypothetical protein